jgi:hypothetical protein
MVEKFATGVVDTGGAPWLANISANFWKNSKRSNWNTLGMGGNWFMKETRSKKSRDTVPLKALTNEKRGGLKEASFDRCFKLFMLKFSNKSVQTTFFASVQHTLRDVYPGSDFSPSRIPDPIFFHPGSTSKNLSILTQKLIFKLSEIWSAWFIPDPDPDFLPIPDPEVKKTPDPGSATLLFGSIGTTCRKHTKWIQ